MLNGKKSVILGSGPVIISTCLDCTAVLCAINVIRCFMSEWIFAYADGIAGLGLHWVESAHVVSGLQVEVSVLLDPSSLCHVPSPVFPRMPINVWLGYKPPGSRVCPQPFSRKAN